MIKRITHDEFRTAFFELRPDNFTPLALSKMFQFLEEIEENTDEEMEFDPIGICCEFSEYENWADLQEEYGDATPKDMDELLEITHVIPVEGERFVMGNLGC